MQEAGPAPDIQADFFSIEQYHSDYKLVLKALHRALKPKRYFEIGTATGGALGLSDCMSLAVDPKFQLGDGGIGVKPACLLFQTTSDSFFAEFDPTALLRGPIDLAFLDGMLWYEFLLRDFMNTERNCKRNSVIVLHDCMPTDLHIARRHPGDMTFSQLSDKGDQWAGDAWKAVAILMQCRPDLVIYGTKVAPTGLILITNLDPTSRVLDQDYFEVVRHFSGMSLDKQRIEEYYSALLLLNPDELTTEHMIAPMFWL